MTMGSTVATAAAAGLTLAGAGLGAIPADAAPLSWHGDVPNSTIIHGHNVTSAVLSLGSPTSVSVVCRPGDASATIDYSGNGKTGLPLQIATILSAKFGANSPCTLNLPFSASIALNLPVGVNASQSTTPHNLTSGVTKGWVGVGSVTTNPISLILTGPNRSCHIVLSVSRIPDILRNTSGIFTINPDHLKTLQIRSAIGCLGDIPLGDPAGIFASYSTSPQLAVSGT
jgi:hypothetical protein